MKKKKENKDMNKSYWLYLQPFVYLSVKKDRAILYNTHNGFFREYRGNNGVMRILRKLDDIRNMYVIPLKAGAVTPEVLGFIKEIRGGFCGDIVDAACSEKKPFQFKPMPRVFQTTRLMTFEPKLKLLQRDEIEEYLEVLDIYINNECSLDCAVCKTAYKQFPHCTKKGNRKNELTLRDLNILLEELKISPIYQLNILGGNILKHSQLLDITRTLNGFSFKKDYYIHYLNAADNPGWLAAVSKEPLNTIHLLVSLPVDKVDKEVLSKVRGKMKDSGVNYEVHFLVEASGDMDVIETLCAEEEPGAIHLHPYFNGRNLRFFSENIFIDKEAVIESGPGMKKIFSNMIINSLNFRRLTVMSGKDVYANPVHPKIGKLGRESIFDIVRKELVKARSWGKVRKNVAPCKGCEFNALCPPISNYEYALGKYNLCTIHAGKEKREGR
jgi:pseudo-rSAM protein